jgi:hypothetical protein
MGAEQGRKGRVQYYGKIDGTLFNPGQAGSQAGRCGYQGVTKVYGHTASTNLFSQGYEARNISCLDFLRFF